MMRVSGRRTLGCSGYTIPALGIKYGGEEVPDPELFALKVLVCVSYCWSGTAGLYRPGILLDSRPIWNGEFSLVGESPTIREGGYTAVRLADVGSLVSGSSCVAPAGTAAR